MRRPATHFCEAHSPHTTEPHLPSPPEPRFKLDIKVAVLAARDTPEAAAAAAAKAATNAETTFSDATYIK